MCIQQMKRSWMIMIIWMYGESLTARSFICPLGVFPAPAFVADFPPVAPEFHQRTHRVRLRNLGTTDKKSSHKIRHRKTPRGHFMRTGGMILCHVQLF